MLIVVELKDHPEPPYSNKSGYPLAFPRPGSNESLDNERVVGLELQLDTKRSNSDALSR